MRGHRTTNTVQYDRVHTDRTKLPGSGRACRKRERERERERERKREKEPGQRTSKPLWVSR
eukprot:COSAG03_NODE_6249_length_1089_cov_1.381433_1_plen_60_part_10